MPSPLFKVVDCTDKTRPRTLRRPDDVELRLAQITDFHVPGEVELIGRLREFMGGPDSIGDLSHHISAISNEFGHPFRKSPRRYLTLIRKALAGLHRVGVDHLVITGDLAHCSLPTEFLDIQAALKVTGWWGHDRLTVIPGNHDRFNLYDDLPKEPMDEFFDVVRPRQPRFKLLPEGVALVEIDTNRDRAADRHPTERFLPNTVGKIYEEDLDWIDKNRHRVEGMRLVTLVHHHITTDWYPRLPTTLGLMEPAEGTDELLEAVELVDPHSLILHGHIHDVMPVEYTHKGHPVGCPGGFAEALRMNLIDFDAHDEMTMTQIELRH